MNKRHMCVTCVESLASGTFFPRYLDCSALFDDAIAVADLRWGVVEMLSGHEVGHIGGVCSAGVGAGILKTDPVRRGGAGALPDWLRGSIVVTEGCCLFPVSACWPWNRKSMVVCELSDLSQ